MATLAVLILSASLLGGVSVILKNNSYTPKFVRTILNNSKIENTLPENLTNKQQNEETAFRQTAKSGVLIEAKTRRVLLDENMNERCFPASTTKVLTALIALERLDVKKQITVKKEGSGIEGSSIYLKVGDKISVLDLLYGMMLRSGNDAACTLAIETAGSVEEFAKLMNEKAHELGAKNSHFVNPHGLHDEEHYTTAYDLALITAKAFENELFERIVSTRVATIEINGEKVAIANKNKLLKEYKGANGVKTGYTKTSGRCLVSGAKRDGMQLVCVTLNYDDMWRDSKRILDFGFENFEMVSYFDAISRKGEKVEINFDKSLDPNDIRVPLKRDGSEALAI